jgi:hypothetical protein
MDVFGIVQIHNSDSLMSAMQLQHKHLWIILGG